MSVSCLERWDWYVSSVTYTGWVRDMMVVSEDEDVDTIEARRRCWRQTGQLILGVAAQPAAQRQIT